MADDPDTPNAGSTADRSDASLLNAYLAERDIPCPGCGYALRGVRDGRCPECGRELALSLAAEAPAWGLEQMALAALFLHLVVFGFLALFTFREFLAGDFEGLFPVLIAACALAGVVRYRVADAQRRPRTDRIAIAWALGTALLMPALVFFLFFMGVL